MDPRPSCFESLASSPFVNRTYGPWRPAVPLPRQRPATTVQHQWRHVIRKEHVSSPALLPERYFFCTLFSVLSATLTLFSPFSSLFLSFVSTYGRTRIQVYTYIHPCSSLSLSFSIYLPISVFLFRGASS